MRSLDIGASGMTAQQKNIEVISNNLANMNTTAYQRRRASFQDLLYQQLRRVGSTSVDDGTVIPSGIQLGLGVKLAAVYRITEQGTPTPNQDPLSLAVNGKGYFIINMPDGTNTYTRDGSFQIGPNQQLVTQDGFTVQPGIVIPEDAIDVTINQAGQVLVKLEGQPQLQNVGQLQLATFVNEAGLEAKGQNLFAESVASGAPVVGVPNTAPRGSIMQGYLEASNVVAVSEITSLIQAQRAYEMNSKVISTSDTMLGTINNIR